MVGPIKLYGGELVEDQWIEVKKDIANANEQNNTINNILKNIIEIPTGSYDGFKLKNIYDLAGNRWSWTTEVGNHQAATSTTNKGLYAVARGGSNIDAYGAFPLCYRYGYASSSSHKTQNFGFRVVLYIK